MDYLLTKSFAAGWDLTTRETLAGWDLTTGEAEPKTGLAEACNIAMGISSSWVLDLYQRADTSGKRGFTYCSKKKEFWKVLKKKEGSLGGFEKKLRNKGLGMIRLLHSDWAKIPSSKLLWQPVHSNNYQ